MVLLPPANEVWGNVMFYTSLSVILFTVGFYDVTSCLADWGSLSLVPHSFQAVSVRVSLSREALSRRGVSVSGVSVQEGSLCPGVDSLPRVSVQGNLCVRGVSVGRPLPQSEKQAVRILLECFLVFTQSNIQSVVIRYRTPLCSLPFKFL